MPGGLPPSPPVTAELRWQLLEAPNVVGVAIMRDDGDDLGWTKIGIYQGDRCQVTGLQPSQRYRFAAAAVYKDGGMTPQEKWRQAELVPMAHDDAPSRPDTPDVSQFAVSQDASALNFTWVRNEDLVTAYYEIRMGTSWDAALLVARGIEGNHLRWGWWASGSTTFLLRAVRADGTYSTSEASVTFDIQPLGDHVTGTTLDESGGGFAGTKTGMAVYSSGLELENVPANGTASTMVGSAATWPGWARKKTSGTYQTADTDLGVLGLHRFELQLAGSFLKVSGLVGSDFSDVPCPVDTSDGTQLMAGANSSWAQNHLADGTPLYPLDVKVEIDTSQTDAASSPSWDGWRAYAPGEFKCRWVRFRFTVRGFGVGSVRITTLKVKQRRRNLKDEGTVSVVASPGPTPITFAAPFSAAPVVVANAAGTEAGYKVVASSVTKTGCNLRVYSGLVEVKVTKAYSDFSAPAGSKVITIYSLPAGWEVVRCFRKHSAAFTGGSVATALLKCGISGTEDALGLDFDVFQAPGDTVFDRDTRGGIYDAGATKTLRATLTVTGDTTNHLTAGSVDIYLWLKPVIPDHVGNEVFTGSLNWHAMGT